MTLWSMSGSALIQFGLVSLCYAVLCVGHHSVDVVVCFCHIADLVRYVRLKADLIWFVCEPADEVWFG